MRPPWAARSRRELAHAPATVFSIYRAENAEGLAPLITALPDRFTVRLWALDAVDPRLGGLTVGTGVGPKFELLNEMLDSRPVASNEHVVVLDDDIEMQRGDLPLLLWIVERARFDLAQPAHSWRSHLSHRFTRRRFLARARLTTFVEIGPLFVVAPQRRHLLLPFPPQPGMGWGLELEWMALHEQGLRLGIADAVAVAHLKPPASAYDPGPERTRTETLLRARGLASITDAQRVIATWRRWQPLPPWVDPHDSVRRQDDRT